jgi:hypothetical protein
MSNLRVNLALITISLFAVQNIYASAVTITDNAYIYMNVAPNVEFHDQAEEFIKLSGHNFSQNILYYANDSMEPLMQAAVDKDLYNLKMACKYMNVVTLRGSELAFQIKTNARLTVDFCVNSKIKKVQFNRYNTSRILKIVANYKKRKGFENLVDLPTGIPEVFEIVLTEMRSAATDPKNYKSKKFTVNYADSNFFLHIKSHGNSNYPVITLNHNHINDLANEQYSKLKPLNKEDLQRKFGTIGSGNLASLVFKILPSNGGHLGGSSDRGDFGLGRKLSPTPEEKVFNKNMLGNILDGHMFNFVFVESCGSPEESDIPNDFPSWLISRHQPPSTNPSEMLTWDYTKYIAYSFFIAKGLLNYTNLDWYKVIKMQPNNERFSVLPFFDSLRSNLLKIKHKQQVILDSMYARTDNQVREASISDAKTNLIIEESSQKFLEVAIDKHLCALKTDHEVVCWLPDSTNELQMVAIDTGVKYRQLDKSCGITFDGTLRCWHPDYFVAPLKTGFTEVINHSAKYQQFSTGFGIEMWDNGPFAKTFFSCGIDFSGWLKCFGNNSNGQVQFEDTPTCLDEGEDCSLTTLQEFNIGVQNQFTQVASGFHHTCALNKKGHIWCWGVNQPYAYEVDDRYIEIQKRGTLKVFDDKKSYKQIFKNDISAHSCAITKNNQAYCWGENSYYQIGDFDSIFVTQPTLIDGGKKYSTLSLGKEHTCGITADDTQSIRCWGDNRNGQINFQKRFDRSIYIQAITIDSGSNYKSVATSFYVTCGITKSGALKCWGDKKSLLNGSNQNRPYLRY